MDDYTRQGQMELVHYFSMASKYDFVSQNIKNGNLVYISDSRNKYDIVKRTMDPGLTKNVGLEVKAFTESHNAFNTRDNTSGQCPRSFHIRHDLTQDDFQRFKMCYFAKSI